MKKYDGRRGIALLLCLLLCLQMCLPPTAVLAEDKQQNIEYTASGYSGTYDGQAHSISVNVTTPEGATVSYAYPVNSEYSSTNPSFTDAENYTVAYKIEKEFYETETGTATVAIEKADVSDKVEATLPDSFTYTGKPVEFVPFYDGIDTWEIDYLNSDGQSISAPSEAGSYTAKIIGSGTNHTATIFHSFTIVEPEKEIDYDVEGFDVEYDGKPHSISLNIRTEGVTATYATSEDGPYSEKNPEFIAIGTYTVFYKLEKSGYSTEEGSVNVKIKPIDISSEIEATLPSSFTWTGKPVQFNPPTDKIKEWSIVYWLGDIYLDSAPSEVDDQYAVAISGESDTYRANIFHKFSIVEAGAVIEYTARDYSGTYDGRQHSIALDVTTPDVTVTYATSANGTYTETKPTFTSAGRYTIYYRLEGEGYETAAGSTTVTISRANVSGLVTFNKQDEYPFTGSPVSFSPSCSGISTWTFTYYDEGGKQLTQAPSDVGSYSVSIYGSGTNYYARVSHAYRIAAQEIEYTADDYTGEYDGEPHTISLEVATAGTTVTYATSAEGHYAAELPTFTEPGTYTVYFRIEKPYCGTVFSSARVVLTQREISYTAKGYSGDYDGKAHSIRLNVETEGVTVTYSKSKDGPYTETKPTFTEPGRYTVYFRLEKPYFKTVMGSAVVEIAEVITGSHAEISYSASGYIGVYDGQPHTITLNYSGGEATYALSKDGTYTATKPTFTEPDKYEVFFRIKTSNRTITDSATVTIEKAEQVLYFTERLRIMEFFDASYTMAAVHEQGDGEVTYSSSYSSLYITLDSKTGEVFTTSMVGTRSDTRLKEDALITITATAAETEHYKAATASYYLANPLAMAAQLIEYGNKASISTMSEEDRAALFELFKQKTGVDCSTLYVDVNSKEGIDIYNGKYYDEQANGSDSSEGLLKTNRQDILIEVPQELKNAYSKVYKDYSAIAVHMKEPVKKDVDIGKKGNGKKEIMIMDPNTIGASGSKSISIVRAGEHSLATPTASATPNPTLNISSNMLANATGDKNTQGSETTLTGSGTLDTANENPLVRLNSSNGGIDIKISILEKGNAGSYNIEVGNATPAQGSEVLTRGDDQDGKLRNNVSALINTVPVELTMTSSLGQEITNMSSGSPDIEYIRCQLTEEGLLIPNTSNSPFAILYGPKEVIDSTMTVRGLDEVFVCDGEGHQVTAEPGIADGTTVYYSQDLQSWQTEAPVLTDVVTMEDGFLGAYLIFAMAVNPDYGAALCSYTVTIVPAE